jgi:hypothetical protein
MKLSDYQDQLDEYAFLNGPLRCIWRALRNAPRFFMEDGSEWRPINAELFIRRQIDEDLGETFEIMEFGLNEDESVNSFKQGKFDE